MAEYYLAWSPKEMMNIELAKPADERFHILNTGGMRTYCNKHSFHKSTGIRIVDFREEVDGVEVCSTCLNKVFGLEKRDRREVYRQQ